MKKQLIIIGMGVLLICVGLSGCIDNVNRAASDTGTCCVLGFLGVILFIILIAYLLGGKKTVVHTQHTTSPPVIIHEETPQEKPKSDRYCPSCGRGIPFDANICPYCSKTFETHQSPIERVKYCLECGKKNDEDAEYCNKCRNKF